MQNNFDQCLDYILRYEGGYSNHPKDPGGETNYGVTKRVYDAYRRTHGLPGQSVRNISRDEIEDIYRKQYWDAIEGDSLPSGVDLAVFDFAVNSGVARAVRTLQQALGVRADGHLGTATLDALDEADPPELIKKICDRRMRFLRSLRTFSTFGKGWTRRVNGVKTAALDMVGPGVLYGGSGDDELFSGKAVDEDMSPTSTLEGKGAVTSTVGVMGTAVSDAAEKVSYLADYSNVLTIIFVVLVVLGIGLTLYGLWVNRNDR